MLNRRRDYSVLSEREKLQVMKNSKPVIEIAYGYDPSKGGLHLTARASGAVVVLAELDRWFQEVAPLDAQGVLNARPVP